MKRILRYSIRLFAGQDPRHFCGFTSIFEDVLAIVGLDNLDIFCYCYNIWLFDDYIWARSSFCASSICLSWASACCFYSLILRIYAESLFLSSFSRCFITFTLYSTSLSIISFTPFIILLPIYVLKAFIPALMFCRSIFSWDTFFFIDLSIRFITVLYFSIELDFCFLCSAMLSLSFL